MEATELTELRLPERSLELEQIAGLEALVLRSVLTGDQPFWATLWPSGRALAWLVGSLPGLRDKRVLDLGCGVGAVAVAAASKGAHVVAADIREEALELTRRNAERNGLEVETKQLDFCAPPMGLEPFDWIFAGDVFYADGMLSGALKFIRSFLRQDGIACVADPNRVMPGGIAGAARLRGLEVASAVLNPSGSITGGVTLYELRRGRRR